MFEPKSFEYVLDVATGVATITLNRPERLNALTFEAYDELRRAFRVLSDEEDARVVVITGAGRGFCSGGDVEDIIGRLFERDMRGLLERADISPTHGTSLSNLGSSRSLSKIWKEEMYRGRDVGRGLECSLPFIDWDAGG